MKHAIVRTAMLILVIVCTVISGSAQGLLDKVVTVNASNQPLGEVLKSVGKQGGFYFSYNSNAVPAKRMVTISANKKTVRQVLDILFDGSIQYKESGTHLILQQTKEKWYTVSGYVIDVITGERITNASVYERQQLVATLTNGEGYFRLRLRDKYPTAAVTISKEWYADTLIVCAAGKDQEYKVPVAHSKKVELEEVTVTQRTGVEKTWFGRHFLSPKLRAQTRNITTFIATRPVQTSFIPGLGTHGKIGAQVVNKFSLNVLGGYTAGVNGVEIGGLFNINKQDVRYVQVGGVFNIVGGNVYGTQVGGVYNGVLDSVRGVQVGGVVNVVGGSLQGIQVAGVHNNVAGSAKGIQVAGISNYVRDTTNGIQVAGIGNVATRDIKGAQISGIFNYARKLSGFQVGIVNVADSLDGYSLGMLNLIKNGYHKFSISANEVLPINAALKTGTSKLYTILVAGMNISANNKAYAFGLGIGRQFSLSRTISITTEITMQHVYLGDWDHTHFLYRAQPELNVRLNKLVTIFAGPSLSYYQSQAATAVAGYRAEVDGTGTGTFTVGKEGKGWIGWQAGISLF